MRQRGAIRARTAPARCRRSSSSVADGGGVEGRDGPWAGLRAAYRRETRHNHTRGAQERGAQVHLTRDRHTASTRRKSSHESAHTSYYCLLSTTVHDPHPSQAREEGAAPVPRPSPRRRPPASELSWVAPGAVEEHYERQGESCAQRVQVRCAMEVCGGGGGGCAGTRRCAWM